jgi:hypothetical protein
MMMMMIMGSLKRERYEKRHTEIRLGAYVKWVGAQAAVSASFEHQHCGFQHPALVQPLLYSG